MSTKHLEPVTTIRNQYMFLQEVEKKDTNSPSRKQEKNAPINQVIFHQIANSRFFLINSRTMRLLEQTISKNQAKKFTVLESRPLKISKKNSFLVNFHIWHKFSSFKTTNCLLMGSNRSHYVDWQTYRGF